jgi:hypothetical protein
MGVDLRYGRDRAGAVAADGKEIKPQPPSRDLPRAAGRASRHDHRNDSITSSGLAAFHNGKGRRAPSLQARYIKTSSTKPSASTQSGHDCQLAIETSGHGALKENYFLDDGAF